MKKFLGTLALTATLSACAAQPEVEAPLLGGQKDTHGCLPSAGQSYSYLKKACVQVFDIADIRMDDPANSTLAVYAILSDDRQQAEVFAADLPENTILDVVKGGYISKDGKVRLSKTNKGWKIKK